MIQRVINLAKEEKEPFARHLLKGYTPKSYMKSIENAVIEEGKFILRGLGKKFIMISSKDLAKYLNNHPILKDPVYCHWVQVGIRRLYIEERVINHREYLLLMAMKRALNKNGVYLLRGDEFYNKHYIEKCLMFIQGKTCYNDSCNSQLSCVLFYTHKMTDSPVKKEKKPHLHPAYLGSEVACRMCNPNCYRKHQFENMDRLKYCGHPLCPMKPVKLYEPETDSKK